MQIALENISGWLFNIKENCSLFSNTQNTAAVKKGISNQINQAADFQHAKALPLP